MSSGTKNTRDGSPRERLAAMIEGCSPGDQIPPEPELAEQLEVSRPKLREMLRTFEDAGLISRRPRTGTVVTHGPRLKNDLSVNTGVTDLIVSHGLEPGTSALRIENRAATEKEVQELDLEPGDGVWALSRVRTANGRPVVASLDVIPASLTGEGTSGSLALDELAQGSLYRVLSDRRHEIHHGVVRIAPDRADDELGEQLEVEPGSLLIRLVQVDYSADGRPLVLSIEHHVADAFELSVFRRGPGT